MNYKYIDEIIVKNQKELDAIPVDFAGRISIKFGTYFKPAIVSKRYYLSVVAWGNSSVVAWGNSSVVARENSSVEAWGNSSVVARENSSVVARGNSSVVARGNSSVVARENSSVVAWENSSVVAWGNSSVVARGNSSVEARENVQVVDYLQGSKIKISGNARIVYMPKNINEFMDFYGIKHTKTKATFYKAVHKSIDGVYYSEYDIDFRYEVGKIKKEECDPNVHKECSYGIHIAHLNWALNFGATLDNLAILEVETKISDIVLPEGSNGKVRTSKVKVIREVPLEECGLYGKILAKRRKANG